jgi:hypothetical protein
MGYQWSVPYPISPCSHALQLTNICATGFLVLLPIYHSSLNSTTYFRAAAATAFLGGSIFEVGSYLMVVEALNRSVSPILVTANVLTLDPALS